MNWSKTDVKNKEKNKRAALPAQGDNSGVAAINTPVGVEFTIPDKKLLYLLEVSRNKIIGTF